MHNRALSEKQAPEGTDLVVFSHALRRTTGEVWTPLEAEQAHQTADALNHSARHNPSAPGVASDWRVRWLTGEDRRLPSAPEPERPLYLPLRLERRPTVVALPVGSV